MGRLKKNQNKLRFLLDFYRIQKYHHPNYPPPVMKTQKNKLTKIFWSRNKKYKIK